MTIPITAAGRALLDVTTRPQLGGSPHLDAILAIEAEAAEDAADRLLLSDATERYKDSDWRKEFKPLEAEAAALDVERLRRDRGMTPSTAYPLRELLIENTDALVSWIREAGQEAEAERVIAELDAALATPLAALDVERLARAMRGRYEGSGKHRIFVLPTPDEVAAAYQQEPQP